MKEEMIDFTYPEGYKKALDSLDFLPEDQRDMIVSMFIPMMLTY